MAFRQGEQQRTTFDQHPGACPIPGPVLCTGASDTNPSQALSSSRWGRKTVKDSSPTVWPKLGQKDVQGLGSQGSTRGYEPKPPLEAAERAR